MSGPWWMYALIVALLVFAAGCLWQWRLNRQAEAADVERQRHATARRVDHPMGKATASPIDIPPEAQRAAIETMIADGEPFGSLMETVRMPDAPVDIEWAAVATMNHPPPPQHRLPPGPLAHSLREAVARYETAEADLAAAEASLAEARAEIARLRPMVEAAPPPTMPRPTGTPMDWQALSAALDPLTSADEHNDSHPRVDVETAT